LKALYQQQPASSATGTQSQKHGPGALISSDKIVKITTTRNPKQVLYSHPKYHTKALVLDFLPSYKQERPFMLFCGGDYHSTFESEEMAIRYCNSWWGVKPVIQYQEFCNV